MDILNVTDTLKRFNWPDYLIFMVMLLICCSIGVYFGWEDHKKKSCSTAVSRNGGALDYLVGGRTMKVLPVSMSLVASLISGIGILGTSTEIYVYGTQYCYILIGIVLSAFVLHYLYLPVFHDLKLTSLYEYLDRRFDRRVRLFGSITFIISTLVKMPIMIYLPALSFNAVSGIDIYIIVPIVCLICIFYTCIGGIKAVVWTDVIQGVVMIGSLTLVAVKATIEVGGLNFVLEKNYQSGRIEVPMYFCNISNRWNLDPTIRSTFWTTVIGGLVLHSAMHGICQTMIQRYVSLPTLQNARQAIWIFTGGVVLLLGFSMYNGLLLYAIYHDCDPLTTGLAKKEDQLVPLLVMQELGSYPGLAGCFIAGIFSASLSSLSTGLNSIAAVILVDFIKPNKKSALSEKKTAFIMKGTVIVTGLISTGLVFIVEKLGTVLELAIKFIGVTYGPLIGIFTIGLTMPYIDGKNALIGACTGFISTMTIVAKTQIDIAGGVLKYPKKPTSVENCSYSFNFTAIKSDVDPPNQNDFFYHVSYLYYTLLGCLITIIVANVMSLFFNKQDVTKIDKKLLSPIIRKYFIAKSYDNDNANSKREMTVLIKNDNKT
uniref:CSON001903 protein n=1 Tax=Culicoides sonorensis TaxID=179676 RepID=A0A336K9Y8_CULSO